MTTPPHPSLGISFLAPSDSASVHKLALYFGKVHYPLRFCNATYTVEVALFPIARWLLRLLSCNKSTTALLSGCESAISRCEDAISRYCTPTPASKDLVKSAISKHDF